MVRGSVGVIFGETGTLEFKMLVSDSTAVYRGAYIKAWHETDGWVLAQVINITRSSESFTIEEAKAGQRKDKSDDRIVAEVIVIGTRDKEGMLRSPTIPFSPGDLIYIADEGLIRSVLGLLGQDMNIGLLEGTGIKVQLSVNSLVQKHCSILAKTGSGKSYTAAVILEELMDRDIPLLIIDPHSEYTSLKMQGPDDPEAFKKYGVTPKSYADRVTVYTPANKAINPDADETFRLNGMNLTVKDLTSIFPDNFSTTHTGILYEAIQSLRAEMETYTIDDIIFAVGNDKSKAKWSVISMLENIRDTDILSPNPTPIEALVRKGKVAILDFKGVPPDMQSMIVAQLCLNLFEARKLDRVPPGMLVIEEAHNYAPEKGFSKTVSTDILRTIASEGRKFGLGMMVISQRPARIDKNVLSQCGTQIIMKVTNPNDLKAISKGLEGVNSYVEDELMRLPAGVAMLVSNDIERPILVDIRIRRSKHGGESVNVLMAAQTQSLPPPPPVANAPPLPEETPVLRKTAPPLPSAAEPATIEENRVSAPPPKRKPSRPPKNDGGKLFTRIFGGGK
ncbi:ATP-binding protein [Methanolobus halotolerans]|uniref:ATPase n=1 Tax=Methanolobus halotolerans TaxID=2052935 RepID=A0A4E0Q5G8_9EURY|nr:ATP-binding protein [Methanolobus halotolerans]TGC09420.1 ATPase [Methanolobus halotolerans]